MKILLVHNKYKQPGGEDVVFEQERRLLVDAGHHVIAYCRSNDETDRLSLGNRLLLPARILWATDTVLDFERLLNREKPDVVHVHNTFMMISPAIYSVCFRYGIPVVQTLHNYRLLCPAATLFRNGQVCESCLDHGLWQSVLYGCYRDSRPATAAVATMLGYHRTVGTWQMIGRYVALTEFARSKFISSGFSAEKISVKPNFVDPDPGVGDDRDDHAVFVGRLDNGKGIETVVRACSKVGARCKVKVIGDGPHREAAEREARDRGVSSISFLGQFRRQDAIEELKKARFVIMPSEGYEGFSMCIVEAFASGTPVLCSAMGSMKEIVHDGRTGLYFNPGDSDDLANKIEWAHDHPAEMAAMGRAARREFETRYTARSNYSQLMQIYEQTLAEYKPASTSPRWIQ